MKTLWLVVARAGSKSVPNKNVRLLGGIPLLQYRVFSARALAGCEDVWISTDSAAYAQVAADAGASVPFLRPAELATDDASSIDVVTHAMRYAQANNLSYDFLGLLEPTSPFVGAKRLLEAQRMLISNKSAEALVSVRAVHPQSFFVQRREPTLAVLAARFAAATALRRQDLPQEITPSGGLYLSRWDAIERNKSFYVPSTLALPVSDLEGIEIDEPVDWEWAEFLMERGRVRVAELFTPN